MKSNISIVAEMTDCNACEYLWIEIHGAYVNSFDDLVNLIAKDKWNMALAHGGFDRKNISYSCTDICSCVHKNGMTIICPNCMNHTSHQDAGKQDYDENCEEYDEIYHNDSDEDVGEGVVDHDIKEMEITD